MDSLLNEETDVVEWLNIVLRNPETIEQDLSGLAIKLQLIEQDLELNLDYHSNFALTAIQSLKAEFDLIYTQTVELSQEAVEVEKQLKSILTPEVFQLQKDHRSLSLITSSKTSLKEIEHLEEKIEKTLADVSRNPLESSDSVQNLFKIWQKLEGIPQYKNFRDRINTIIERFDEILTDNCITAAASLNTPQLKKLLISFQCIERSDKFKKLLLKSRFDLLPQDPFDNSAQAFARLKLDISKETSLFKDIFLITDLGISTFFCEYFDQIGLLKDLDSLSIETHRVFYEEVMNIAKLLKDSLGTTQPLHSSIKGFTQYLKTEEKHFSILQQSITRPITLLSWSNEISTLLINLESSWSRSLTASFGTCGFDWARMAESLISSKIKQLNENYSEIANFPVDLIPDFEEIETNNKFKWEYANKFVKIFEEILQVYNRLEVFSENCRGSFLQSMTTSYYSPSLEIQKEIQSAIFKSDEKLLKNNLGLISFLREGGVFFAKSLEMIEKELDICRLYFEKLLMSPISISLKDYSDLPCWVSEDSMFSVSPSPPIIICGDHILSILQFVSPCDDIYTKAFQLFFSSRPSSDLPHSVALHFWVSLFFSRYFRTLILKLSKIKSINKQGKKCLMTDIEYIYNIAQALGIFKQDEICGQNFLQLRTRLQEGLIDDLSKVRTFY